MIYALFVAGSICRDLRAFGGTNQTLNLRWGTATDFKGWESGSQLPTPVQRRNTDQFLHASAWLMEHMREQRQDGFPTFRYDEANIDHYFKVNGEWIALKLVVKIAEKLMRRKQEGITQWKRRNLRLNVGVLLSLNSMWLIKSSFSLCRPYEFILTPHMPYPGLSVFYRDILRKQYIQGCDLRHYSLFSLMS